MANRIRSFLNLERGEEWPAFLLFLYLTLILTTYLIAKAVRDALFLFKFPATDLPYVYMAVAAVIGIVVAVYVRLSKRFSLAALTSGSLIFFMINLLAFWQAARLQWRPLAPIFYIWTSIFGIIITTQVWTVANHVLNVRQAKRLFPLVSSGGILGGSFGGLIAAVLVKYIGTDGLVITMIPILILCALVVQILMRRYALPSRASASIVPSRKHLRAVVQSVWESRYLKLIASLLTLSAIVTLIVGFQFMFVVQQSATWSKEQLTVFFGQFYAYLGFASFLLQFLAGSRIMEKVGLRLTVFVLPVALLGGTTILLAYPLRLWAGILLKGSDQTLRYSIDKATIELLYVPVPQSIKADVKAFIDMVLQRLADGLGGFLLLLLTPVHGLAMQMTCVFNAGLLALWLWFAYVARKLYADTLREAVERDRPPIPAAIRPAVSNLRSIATLTAMLKSREEEVVLYAMEILTTIRRTKFLTRDLLTHPSPRVRAKVLEALQLAKPDILAYARTENDSVLRISAVQRAMAMKEESRHPSDSLHDLLKDPDLRMRLAGLSILAQRPSAEDSRVLSEHFAAILRELEEKPHCCRDVAEALGDISHPAAIDLHLHLLRHADSAVKKQAILSAGKAGHRELIPFLIPLLAASEFAGDARLALSECGPRILGTLGDVLKDPSAPLEIRRAIPLVLAIIPAQESASLLVYALSDYDGLVRYRALRALCKLRLLDSDLRFDHGELGRVLREECERIHWYRQALSALYPSGRHADLLAQLLMEKVAHGRERVFRLLSLMLPPTPGWASFIALIEEDQVKKPNAIEYIETALPPSLRKLVLPLVEERSKLQKPKQGVRAILEAFLKSPNSVLRDCAANAIRKQRWNEFPASDPALSALKEGPSYG